MATPDDRLGFLGIVAGSRDEKDKIEKHLMPIVRSVYSMPGSGRQSCSYFVGRSQFEENVVS